MFWREGGVGHCDSPSSHSAVQVHYSVITDQNKTSGFNCVSYLPFAYYCIIKLVQFHRLILMEVSVKVYQHVSGLHVCRDNDTSWSRVIYSVYSGPYH